ncbi:hypothetical protein H6F93_01315 [Leptolyngbya sp. FACHB-671]|uniref:hypothetical protein n=1 Tax=Leptolyngbya sp. FACHB-671 TaxID=2692812 RepID=UPI00168589B9|nr:hypothetical protein [Leptolyngbya sp. FACHB-671]MBD2066178.1 hypothetical protein [Leptolyngbya sp. FACHB-671]
MNMQNQANTPENAKLQSTTAPVVVATEPQPVPYSIPSLPQPSGGDITTAVLALAALALVLRSKQ